MTVGGLTVIEVPSREEAHKWPAKWATACRCDQEIWELGFDPKHDAMLREVLNEGHVPTPDAAPEQDVP